MTTEPVPPMVGTPPHWAVCAYCCDAVDDLAEQRDTAERREHTANLAVDVLQAEVKELRAKIGSDPDLYRRLEHQHDTIKDLQAEVARLKQELAAMCQECLQQSCPHV
jgi:predicted  nucleic acid-binding Zn-ribbon protein